MATPSRAEHVSLKLLMPPLVLALLAVMGLLALGLKDPKIPIAAIGGVVVLAVCIISPKIALHLMVMAFLLSPEIPIGRGSGTTLETSRPVTIRAEDVILILLLLSWAVRMGLNPKVGLAVKTPINFPLFVFIGINVVATFIGIAAQTVNALSAFFYVAKYIEYYMFFFITCNLVESREQIRNLFVTAVVTCLAVCVYALYQHYAMGMERVSAPFEGPAGEPNTLGGYLVFMMAFFVALFLETRRENIRWLCAGLAAFVGVPFLLTLSRGSYLAAMPMVAVIFYGTRRKNLLLSLVLMGMLVLLIWQPKAVKDRITYTVNQPKYKNGNIVITKSIHLDTSTTERVRSWRTTMKRWLKTPMMVFLGAGATGVGFIDAQYIRVLCENGGVGLVVFLWLMWVLYSEARRTYSLAVSDFERGLALGYMGGLAALCVHGLSANTFVVVRIMEPFWFMTALLMTVRRLHLEDEEAVERSLRGDFDRLHLSPATGG